MYSSIAHLGFNLFESLSELHSEQNLNCESWQILTKPWESGGCNYSALTASDCSNGQQWSDQEGNGR